MSRADDLRAAGDAARLRVDEARRALAETRDAVGGGRARGSREAQEHLAALRRAIETDVATLRTRVVDGRTALDGGPAAALRGGLGAGAIGLVGLVGAGLLARRAVARGAARRAEDRRAEALAAALARREGRTDTGRRGGGLAALALGAAAAAGAAALAARRTRPPSDDEVWVQP